jgi:uncharacterized protein YndB with AHSA1/START domain
MTMPHEFEVRKEIALDATPEQVWEAIATGPGVNSWFMGQNEIEPREGGKTRMSFGGDDAMESTVTAWEPGRRLAYRGEESPDGLFMAFEYLIEGREGGSTVLRLVHSGFLGDDWESEYDALNKGDGMYLRKLAVYLKHFAGRTSSANLFLVGPQVTDADQVASAYAGAFGLTQPVTPGATGRLSVDGLPVDHAVVEFADPEFLGVRTTNGLHMLVYARDTVVIEHHAFTDELDGKQLASVWQAWLDRTFAGAGTGG